MNCDAFILIPHAPVSGTELTVAAGIGILAGFGSGLLTVTLWCAP